MTLSRSIRLRQPFGMLFVNNPAEVLIFLRIGAVEMQHIFPQVIQELFFSLAYARKHNRGRHRFVPRWKI